jgi:hypothetical protein
VIEHGKVADCIEAADLEANQERLNKFLSV